MAATLMNPAKRITLARVNSADISRMPRKQGNAVVRRRNEINASGTDDLAVRFAVQLRAMMDKRGLRTAKEVFDLLVKAGVDVGPRGIDVWLRGEGLPKWRDLERIGQALGLRDYRRLLPPPLPKK